MLTPMGTEKQLLEIVNEDFDNLREMLTVIQRKIKDCPATTQLDFIKPIKHLIAEAFQDAVNPDDSFLYCVS